MLAPSDVVGEQARSRDVAESRTVAPFGTQAERKSSPIPRRGHRTCSGTEEGAFLAGVWTIVAVAGQTQEHHVTLVGLACRERAIDRATTVPKHSRGHIRGRFAELVPRFPAAKIHGSAAAQARTFFARTSRARSNGVNPSGPATVIMMGTGAHLRGAGGVCCAAN